MPFSTINRISISVSSSSFTSVFFKAACHANPGAERNFTGYKWQILKHIVLKFSKTPVKSNITNHDIHLNVLFQNLYKFFLYVSDLHL